MTEFEERGMGRGIHTSAKHAEKALLAKVPAKEISDLELPPPTMVSTGRRKCEEKGKCENNK